MTNEKQSNRLAELLREMEGKPEITCPRNSYEEGCSGCKYEKGAQCDHEARKADHLIKKGVIVPPCMVGDVLYEIDLPEYGIITCKATKVLYDSGEIVVNVIDGHGKGSEYYFEFDDFGKTVFLSREEAEEALKGGAE